MNHKLVSRFSSVLISLALSLLPEFVFACAVCYGDPNSQSTKAIKWAVFSLFFIIISVLSGFAYFMFYLKKRAELFAKGDKTVF